MRVSTVNFNALWASILIEELVRHDISHCFVSPGSRSTPLTVAAARNPRVTTVVHFDERGAAFAAVGYVRATSRPAVLICTSGTAVANYLPAVVEASMDRLPLIVLSADRPPELQNCGANQTIVQPGIFSHYARYELLLPCPDPEISATTLLSRIDRVARAAMTVPRGPVHINCPFREPLAPTDDGRDYTTYLKSIEAWGSGSSPWSRSTDPDGGVDQTAVHTVSGIIAGTADGIIVAGMLTSEADRDAVLALSEATGWPALPDIQSGLRLGLQHPNVIPNYDLILHSKAMQTDLTPSVVIHAGGRVISKRLLQWLERIRPTRYVCIDGDLRDFDPNHQVTDRIHAAISRVCHELVKQVPSASPTSKLAAWQSRSELVAETVDPLIANGALTEPAITHLLSQLMDRHHALWLASSLPIRLMDMYGASSSALVPIGANRGASGIDGTVASAVGFAQGQARPVTLLTGDLALLHDLNSLALVRTSPHPVTIVVLNNDGGGIFSLLPIAEHGDVFERYFTTPHGMKFENAAAQFDLAYRCVQTLDDFQIAYVEQRSSRTSIIIEIPVDRRTTADLIRRVERSVGELVPE
ncbi:MAG: 2-succinyl-5-enolpyruvyl-6-hydroxy-3-cyclohexene-1-carboxylic-acid synthase [candidate division Zixibacteria bacterium]|jgi:2-succinyl-5-enolpyruvyl-6-hydroxy-3-cyclohexene-1-carboxylate synthase|nr:2-succinyl-5-enolpyruvyl-6-hydroxy-3-cyclohexene-1-carboxylic-acid synthase [candidate division Zixibacteria bacterium]